MLRKMLVVLTFGAAVIAGCGGDDGGSGGSGGSGGGSSANPNVQAAIDSCKQSIDAQAQLKPDTVTELKKICEDAGNGDIEDTQAAAKKVCVKIVEDTVPSGAAQDQAKSACEQTAP